MKKDCVLFTAHGAWLQTKGEDGRMRQSFMGKHPMSEVQGLCELLGMEFVDVRVDPAKGVEWSCAA